MRSSTAATRQEAGTAARYTAVSALALGLDLLLYMAQLAGGSPAWLAAANGYAAGMALHYLLSRWLVFGSASTGAAQRAELAGFIASGLFGLALTTAIIAVGVHGLGASPVLGKAAAVGLSFAATYALRRLIVFAR